MTFNTHQTLILCMCSNFSGNDFSKRRLRISSLLNRFPSSSATIGGDNGIPEMQHVSQRAFAKIEGSFLSGSFLVFTISGR